MTFVFDERHQLEDKPGLHALIVGISSYPHLIGGTGKPASENFKMEQLTSAALTAYKMYRCLLKLGKNFPVQLASIQLLVSPSLEELSKEPNLKGLTPCTLDNFLEAANQWREEAAKQSGNMTLFYFAGHGIRTITKKSSILLMEDFGDGRGSLLHKSIDFSSIYDGMAAYKKQKNIAKTQLYFVDGCRDLPNKLKGYQSTEATNVFDIHLDEIPDKRRAPIIYATVPNDFAEGIPGEQTVFSKALLKYLDGYGGDVLEERGDALKENSDKVKWHISVFTLNRQLQAYLYELRQNYEKLEQEFIIDGISGIDTTIVFLENPPLTDLILRLEPPSVIDHAHIQVKSGRKIVRSLPPIESYPYRFPVSCVGKYKIITKVDLPNLDLKNQPEIVPKLERPYHYLSLKITL